MNDRDFEHLTRNVKGGYTCTAWAVVDSDGNIVDDDRLILGRFLVVEDPYSCVVLTIDSHNRITRIIEE